MASSCKSLFESFKYLSKWDLSANPKIKVTTCFLQRGDKVLVLQRARRDEQCHLWGIPGGKLEDGENPVTGLCRELYEECQVSFQINDFQFLASALSYTPSDGDYGLYIYYALVVENLNVIIDLSEHSAFQWVTIPEFESLELLTAQREAFWLVKDQLLEKMKTKRSYV